MSNPVEATELWIRNFVVRLNLCPFAGEPLGTGRVRIIASRADETAEVLAELLDEVTKLEEDLAATTLLVIPQLGLSFDDLLQLHAAAEDLLEAEGWQGEYQLASFHPDYSFANAPEDDPANATNQSPHPMLHLLRWTDVRKAVEDHPDIDSVYARNVELLRRLATGGPAATD